jgi:hypothetical protein
MAHTFTVSRLRPCKRILTYVSVRTVYFAASRNINHRTPCRAFMLALGPLSRRGKQMKVAIVHEWLVTLGGSEKVLQQIMECFPQADIFTLIDYLDDRSWLKGKQVKTSFIQNLPFARKHYRTYLPLMPLAIEQFDLSAYDLIISSSHAVAKGVLSGPDQLHISYVHSPIRYAWDLQHQYLREAGLTSGFKSALARVLLHYIRGWDVHSANSRPLDLQLPLYRAQDQENLWTRCHGHLSARRCERTAAAFREERLLSDGFTDGAVQAD